MKPSSDRRVASETAILDAACSLMAAAGPDGVSLRDVARHAGCTHTLVNRYFGSKDDLAAAVGDQTASRVAAKVGEVLTDSSDPWAELLATARRHPLDTRLLIRCALGDLAPAGFPSCLQVDRVVASALDAAGAPRVTRRVRLGVYGASCMVLGWITFEDFVVNASRLRAVAVKRRDRAVSAAVGEVLHTALSGRALLSRQLSYPLPHRSVAATSRAALLDAAIALFAEHGPASVTVRDVADRAGINVALIYRHFGSKDALLAEAIDEGSGVLLPAAWAAPTFDFDAMSHLMHHQSPAPRLIARALVDGIDISSVRTRFPVLRGLLDTFEHVPTGPGPGDLSDPRIAVATTAAMALGSVIWGSHLRSTLGLTDDNDIEVAVSDLARTAVAHTRELIATRNG